MNLAAARELVIEAEALRGPLRSRDAEAARSRLEVLYPDLDEAFDVLEAARSAGRAMGTEEGVTFATSAVAGAPSD